MNKTEYWLMKLEECRRTQIAAEKLLSTADGENAKYEINKVIGKLHRATDQFKTNVHSETSRNN